MNTPALTKLTIISELSRIPDDSLHKVRMYLDSLLAELHASPPKKQSLQGIWKDAGFEKLANLEDELRIVRKELDASILRRTF